MKTTITDLLQKITPLPWRQHDMEADAIVGSDRKAIAIVLGKSRTKEQDAAHLKYLVHTANTLPKLLEALTRISNGNDVARMSEWANDALTLAREVEL